MPKGIYKHKSRTEKTKKKISKTMKRITLKGKESHRWKGGRTISSGGYVLIYKPEHPDAYKGGYVMEHKLIMEKHLGRPLQWKEEIHHLDQNKTNNEIDNLHLFDNTVQHQNYHKFLRDTTMEVIENSNH